MLIIIPHNHRYWLEEGGRWEFFWISMCGQEAVRIHRIIQAVTGPVFQLRAEAIERLARCSLRLIEGAGDTPGTASSIAYEAAMALYDEVFGAYGGTSMEDNHSPIRFVREHVLANLDKPLSVSELAEIAGVSRAHFSRVFAASVGMPPAEFVLHERMRRAARLLTSHALLPVKEISPLCGFDEPNYFAKVFRRFFGTSPTEFRTTGMYAGFGNQGADGTQGREIASASRRRGGGDSPRDRGPLIGSDRPLQNIEPTAHATAAAIEVRGVGALPRP
jgi:AraC-like DNA-binding protein